MNAAADRALGERLIHFVRRVREIAADAPSGGAATLQRRLRKLLPDLASALIGTGSPSHIPAPPRPMVAPLALSALVSRLSEELSSARLRGDFINPWLVTGLKTKEVRNAAVLAWLLNPRADHGLSTRPLTALFSLLAEHDPQRRPALVATEACVVRTEYRPENSERDRVDLAVSGPGFLLFLEVKIRAPEGHEQLARYIESADSQARAMHVSDWRVAYLTVRAGLSRPDIIPITWIRLVSKLRFALADASGSARSIQQLLSHFSSFGR